MDPKILHPKKMGAEISEAQGTIPFLGTSQEAGPAGMLEAIALRLEAFQHTFVLQKVPLEEGTRSY